MDALRLIEEWFAARGWEPFDFQREVWRAQLAGRSGLLHAPTGMGKTLAVWLAPLARGLTGGDQGRRSKVSKLRVLWITPMRALAADTAAALSAPLQDLQVPWRVAGRTGDTSSSTKARQEKHPPEVLVTTPESLTLLLTRDHAPQFFQHLELVVVDEWHELLGSKRGIQTELALARLRRFQPGFLTWGLSATLGNLDEALEYLMGYDEQGARRPGLLVQGAHPKEMVIDSLLPTAMERFPWAGHLGLKMLPQVVAELAGVSSALIFTNTRSQAEIWFQALVEARPDWRTVTALHHGSLDREERTYVEEGLRNGALRFVVCTSSLDLGVDFSPVERVLQIGSPKGVARLMQRAGRSGHSPGRVSRVTCVPTNALELLEVAAARDAVQAGFIESRLTWSSALDVLVQHAVTVALGQGFQEDELFREVRTTDTYAKLSPQEWRWVLDFVTTGGQTLQAYPEYQRVNVQAGVYRLTEKKTGQRHRLSIGTIMSDTAVTVRYLRGSRLGTVEESFISRLHPGDVFIFAGKTLELVKYKENTAFVRQAAGKRGAVPVWYGGRMPLSTELCHFVRARLDRAAGGDFSGTEMAFINPLLTLQAQWSRVPAADDLLIESIVSREGHHLFIYPFEGRLVHEGLAALLALRLSRLAALTFTWAVNDYGFELLSSKTVPLKTALTNGLLSAEGLLDDIRESINLAELAKNQFREVARVAGLVFAGYPGRNKTVRQVQVTSNLLYSVFEKYDPENLLLSQARKEVLERQLEANRLQQSLGRLSQAKLIVTNPEHFTPLAFPLMTDRLRHQLSSEKFLDRVERLVNRLERAARKEKGKRLA